MKKYANPSVDIIAAIAATPSDFALLGRAVCEPLPPPDPTTTDPIIPADLCGWHQYSLLEADSNVWL
jgi:hypothetical protein